MTGPQAQFNYFVVVFPEVATQEVTAVVHATTQGVTVQFPLTQPDGCKSGVKCPVQNGATNVYNYTLPVDSSFPKVTQY